MVYSLNPCTLNTYNTTNDNMINDAFHQKPKFTQPILEAETLPSDITYDPIFIKRILEGGWIPPATVPYSFGNNFQPSLKRNFDQVEFLKNENNNPKKKCKINTQGEYNTTSKIFQTQLNTNTEKRKQSKEIIIPTMNVVTKFINLTKRIYDNAEYIDLSAFFKSLIPEDQMIIYVWLKESLEFHKNETLIPVLNFFTNNPNQFQPFKELLKSRMDSKNKMKNLNRLIENQEKKKILQIKNQEQKKILQIKNQEMNEKIKMFAPFLWQATQEKIEKRQTCMMEKNVIISCLRIKILAISEEEKSSFINEKTTKILKVSYFGYFHKKDIAQMILSWENENHKFSILKFLLLIRSIDVSYYIDYLFKYSKNIDEKSLSFFGKIKNNSICFSRLKRHINSLEVEELIKNEELQAKNNSNFQNKINQSNFILSLPTQQQFQYPRQIPMPRYL